MWKRKCNGMGIDIGESCLYTLQFADDQVVMAQDKEDLEYMTRKLIEEYSKWGLSMNIDKTEYLCIGTDLNDTDLNLNDNKTIRTSSKYKYLGVLFDKSGKDDLEIKERIMKGRKVISCLNSILWSKTISKKRKYNIYNTMIKSILLYGAETWRLSEANKKKILATEMDAIRRSSRISRRDRVRNEVVRQNMGLHQTIIDEVEQRQLIWYGHVQRMTDERLPKRVLQWNPTARRRRGRPPRKWGDGIRKAMSARNLQEGSWNNKREWKLGIGRRRQTL